MKKLILALCVMILGIFTLQAQSVPPTCYSVTNSINCPIQICMNYNLDCIVTGGFHTVTPQQSCVSIAASGSGSLCIPNSDPGSGVGTCTVILTSFTFTNTSSGSVITLSLAESNQYLEFLKGRSGSAYILPREFASGACTDFIHFINSGGLITINANTLDPCVKYCFNNISGCYFDVQMISYCLDDYCTEGTDGGKTSTHLPMGDGNPNNGCLDFGYGPTGCPLCPCTPNDPTQTVFRFCAGNTCPCVDITLADILAGGGAAKPLCICGDQDAKNGIKVTMVNGVITIERIHLP